MMMPKRPAASRACSDTQWCIPSDMVGSRYHLTTFIALAAPLGVNWYLEPNMSLAAPLLVCGECQKGRVWRRHLMTHW